MERLTSKVQYNNFEPGEFIDVQERNYEETIKLIEDFPWNSQRAKIVVELTNPSITIEHRNGSFLKLAIFFNQKYVLRYFDKKRVLFTRSFVDLKESYSSIERFFDEPEFEPIGFKRENTWLQYNLKHFSTCSFRYVLSLRTATVYLLSTSGINFCISMVGLISIFSRGLDQIDILGLIAVLILAFFVGGGLNLMLFFNYYNYAKNKVLIMSKGNDSFSFGNIDCPETYCKRNIVRYTTVKIAGSRSPYSGFAIIEIEFMNGILMKIPNLLLNEMELKEKLSGCQKIDRNKFPYLRT